MVEYIPIGIYEVFPYQKNKNDLKILAPKKMYKKHQDGSYNLSHRNRQVEINVHLD
jgi:hypothetical protein